jgi:hypothetical protein
MREAVRRGLFERVAARTHEIATHFDNTHELLDEWLTEEEEWASPGLERRLRARKGPVDVVNRVVFHLYRKI